MQQILKKASKLFSYFTGQKSYKRLIACVLILAIAYPFPGWCPSKSKEDPEQGHPVTHQGTLARLPISDISSVDLQQGALIGRGGFEDPSSSSVRPAESREAGVVLPFGQTSAMFLALRQECAAREDQERGSLKDILQKEHGEESQKLMEREKAARVPLEESQMRKILGQYLVCFLTNLVTDLSSREEFIALGNEDVIRAKIMGLAGREYWGRRYGYEKNLDAAREFNESLIERGDRDAIERKMSALSQGGDLDHSTWFGDQPTPDTHTYCTYGYEKNPAAARELNDTLIERGDQGAIKRKIEGLSFGRYGYEKNPAAVKEFNELLVKRDDNEALGTKIQGLEGGYYGYEKNPAAARELNETLVERGNPDAIKRKISGLSYGQFGYEKNPAAVKEFNEILVERGDQEAIKRKIIGGLEEGGRYCHEENADVLREFIDALVKKGELLAFSKKVEGLFLGTYGYKRDLVAARELNEILVAQGDPEAVQRKIEGLIYGRYGYERYSGAEREFIESLVAQGYPGAIQRKIHGLEMGTYGYRRDLSGLREFIELLVSRGNVEAIQIKIRASVEGKRGYERKPAAAREFIEDLLMSKNHIFCAIGKYIKAFALKYGVSELGYEKDREKAVKFIQENRVLY